MKYVNIFYIIHMKNVKNITKIIGIMFRLFYLC